MKIYAKQVPPEYQNYYYEPECWPGIILHGNRDYTGRTTPEFDAIYERFDGEKRILRALHLLTGKRYATRIIRGYSQREWQTVYFPVEEYNRGALDILEIEYFNLGTEWTVNVDGCNVCVYAHGDTPEKIRAEIADTVGASVEKIRLQTFVGWKRMAEYTEV